MADQQLPLALPNQIRILATALDVAGCQRFLTGPDAGGQVIFVGTVRQFTDTGNTGYLASENLGYLPSGFNTKRSAATATQKPAAVAPVIETVALEYETYEPLALNAMRQLIDDARAQFQLIHAVLEHRIGRVEIGEPAILIGASSQHRKQAFAAVEYLIDQVKSRIPVWKRELLADGRSHWVHPKPLT